MNPNFWFHWWFSFFLLPRRKPVQKVTYVDFRHKVRINKPNNISQPTD